MTVGCSTQEKVDTGLPDWVPESALHYLLHTEAGQSIRSVARDSGQHASTVLRRIRRFESRRDDPLVDEALRRLGREHFQETSLEKDDLKMTATLRAKKNSSDSISDKEALRVLRRLNETGAIMAVGKGLDKAVIMRELPGGNHTRTAVVSRDTAQAMALKDWISCKRNGQISQYEITSAGQAALKRMIAKTDISQPGFHDAQAVFGDQHRVWGEKKIASGDDEPARVIRYNTSETPLASLARRKDKNGKPFLTEDLVVAGERLREDFELAQMGPRVTQNWEKFLTGGARGSFNMDTGGDGSMRARERVRDALADLGPGLGDVVLRCCCYLEGMEAAEKRMGWSARSGKIVLRIALQRLQRHYEQTYGRYGPMIG